MEEEHIEYLEKRIKNSRRIFEEVGTHTFLDEEIMTIIEELIEGYKTYRGQLNGAFDRGFIPISVIQNTLKEIDKKEKEELKGLKGQDRYFVKQMYQYMRKPLDEILEKGNK